MIRYLKQYKVLLFLTVLFTAISSLSYVFIAILLQQVMDIVDMGDMDGFIRILLFSLAYFAFMGVFMYLQSLFSKKFVCKIMKAVRSKTFMGIEKHTIEDYSKNNTADYLSAITNDVKMIEDNFLLTLLQVIQYTIIFIASLAVMTVSYTHLDVYKRQVQSRQRPGRWSGPAQGACKRIPPPPPDGRPSPIFRQAHKMNR